MCLLFFMKRNFSKYVSLDFLSYLVIRYLGNTKWEIKVDIIKQCQIFLLLILVFFWWYFWYDFPLLQNQKQINFSRICVHFETKLQNILIQLFIPKSRASPKHWKFMTTTVRITLQLKKEKKEFENPTMPKCYQLPWCYNKKLFKEYLSS